MPRAAGGASLALRARLRTLAALPVGALARLVPRRRALVVFGAARVHADSTLGILRATAASGGLPAGLEAIVVASARHRADPRLRQAAAAAGARIVAAGTPRAAWAVARAGWVLLPAHRDDAGHMALGGARLVYTNHGPWIKRMPARPPPGRASVRLFRALLGRYRLVLASHEDEAADYAEWKGPGPDVVCLGYPRWPLLEEARAQGLNPSKVGLYPTWKDLPDPSYGEGLARAVHAALVEAGVPGACVEYRPHHLSGDRGVTLGRDDGRRAGLVVTDFSSLALEQPALGGRLLLYSRVADVYLARRGVRPALVPWLRRHLVEDEGALARRVVEVVQGRDPGVPPALRLRPFDAPALWRLLAA